MHPILRYCQENKVRVRDFAKRIGRSPQLLSDAFIGRCGLSTTTCRRAVEASGGKITLEELVMWQPSDDQSDAA